MTRGVTLVELLVVLAILALIFAVSGVAIASLQAPREAEWARAARHACAEAIRSGKAVSITTHHAPRPTYLLFLPDGRALGPGVDPLTGAPGDAR